MQTDMPSAHDVEGTAAGDAAPTTPWTLPLSANVPSNHHAIITMSFYGGNQKTVAISAGVSSQTWLVPHGLDNPGCEVLPFILSTSDPDILSIDVTCMTRPSSGTPTPMTPIDITRVGGERSSGLAAQSYLVLYSMNPMEAVGITIVVQVGSGPVIGDGH